MKYTKVVLSLRLTTILLNKLKKKLQKCFLKWLVQKNKLKQKHTKIN